MKADTWKGATLCSSDRTHLWLTWHPLPLSATKNPPAKHVGCILTPVLVCVGPEYARTQMLCRQDPDSRKQPGGKTVRLFFRRLHLKPRGFHRTAAWRAPSVFRTHLIPYWFACGMAEKNNLKNDSYLLPLQGCRDEILPLVENEGDLDICFRGPWVGKLAGQDGKVKDAEPGG